MTELSGRDLEDQGSQIFARMGLVCVHRLNQVRLREIAPQGMYSPDDHLEFDFLIPVDRTCLVGEIKGGKNAGEIKSGYSRFKKHLTAATNWKFNENNLRLIGIPDELHKHFLHTTQVKGFYIVANLQKFDVDISEASNVARFFKVDWNLLKEYADILGPFTKPHFLDGFDLSSRSSINALEINKDEHNLLLTENKIIASEVALSDVFTFEASPYALLPIAKVFRRDELPDLSEAPDMDFQRPLVPKKLREIRQKLISMADFMFPNSILGVLSNDCSYEPSRNRGTLRIPGKYGALSIIDGQHRLFSYADESIKARYSDESKILVTAIKFGEAPEKEVHKYSARTFVEINTNQTRVQTSHLDAIAYELLGRIDPRAIAAQVILKSNVARGALYGIFKTNQTELGVIPSTTVAVALRGITDLKKVQDLIKAQRGRALDKRRGYETLFHVNTIGKLCQPDILIRQGVKCFTTYFGKVAKTFPMDWPERDEKKATSLTLAKMFAGFVRLLSTFISEGLTWNEVEIELRGIRDNVKKLRRLTKDDKLIFVLGHRHLPNAQPSASSDYRFLNENRKRPTSIQKVLPKK